MKKWKIERIATFDDDELCNKLDEIESNPNCKVKDVVFIGNNTLEVRIYQIIYTEE